jgi:MFS family permease
MLDLVRDRNLSLLLVDCAIFGFTLGLALLVVPLYTLTLSDSPLVLAAVVAVFPLTAILLSLASGAISDAVGSPAMMVAGFSLMACGCLVLAVSRSWQTVLVGQVFLGLGDVTYWIPAFALVTRFAPSGHLYAVQGLASAAQWMGTIAGPFVGGVVARLAGYPAAFLIGGGLGLLGLLLALCLRAGVREGRHVDSALAHVVAYHRNTLTLLLHDQRVMWANLMHAAILLTWPLMRGSFYLALLSSRGLSPADSGAMVSAHLLVGAVAGLLIGRLGSGRSMQRLLPGIAMLGAVTVGITPLLPSVPLLAAVACLGGVIALYMPMLIGFLAESTSLPEQSMGVALLNLSWAVVSPLGAFIVGVVVDQTSLSAAFYVTEAGVVILVALLWVWVERGPHWPFTEGSGGRATGVSRTELYDAPRGWSGLDKSSVE